MLEFKKLEIGDIQLVKKYFNYSKSKVCDNTVGGAFIWRELFKTYYAIADNSLVFRVNFLDKGSCFTFPLAETEKETEECIKVIKEYAKITGMPFRFCQVPESGVDILSSLYDIEKENASSWGDFLYNADDIINLQGRKYSKIRNHIHHFSNEFPNYKYESIDNSNIEYIKKFLDKYEKNTVKDSPTFKEDIEKTREILDNFDLYGMTGGCIMINDNQVIAFDIGEVINDVLFVHIEKADVEYNGSFQMIVWEYAKHNAKRGMYINREDAAGDEGLETAKSRWFPCNILNKYFVTIKNEKA